MRYKKINFKNKKGFAMFGMSCTILSIMSIMFAVVFDEKDKLLVKLYSDDFANSFINEKLEDYCYFSDNRYYCDQDDIKKFSFYKKDYDDIKSFYVVEENNIVYESVSLDIDDHTINEMQNDTLNKDTFRVSDYGAIIDDGLDDTEAINAAIDDLKNNGGGILLFDNGNYNVSIENEFPIIDGVKRYNYYYTFGYENNVVFSFKNFEGDITIDLNGATLNLADNSMPGYKMFMFYRCKNVIIKNGTLIGDRKTHDYAEHEEAGSLSQYIKRHEWGHGVVINNSNVIIDNMNISNFTGDALVVADRNPYQESNIAINNVELSYARRMGLTIEITKNVIVNNLYIHHIGTFDGIDGLAPMAGIDIESEYSPETPAKNILLNRMKIEKTTNHNIVCGSEKFTDNFIIENSSFNGVLSFFDAKMYNTVFDFESSHESTLRNVELHNSTINQNINNSFLKIIDNSVINNSVFNNDEGRAEVINSSIIDSTFYMNNNNNIKKNNIFRTVNVDNSEFNLNGHLEYLYFTENSIINNSRLTGKYSDTTGNYLRITSGSIIKNSTISDFQGYYLHNNSQVLRYSRNLTGILVENELSKEWDNNVFNDCFFVFNITEQGKINSLKNSKLNNSTIWFHNSYIVSDVNFDNMIFNSVDLTSLEGSYLSNHIFVNVTDSEFYDTLFDKSNLNVINSKIEISDLNKMLHRNFSGNFVTTGVYDNTTFKINNNLASKNYLSKATLINGSKIILEKYDSRVPIVNTNSELGKDYYVLYNGSVPLSPKITFLANDGTDSVKYQVITGTNSFALDKNTFNRKGYNFIGWNTEEAGNGNSYSDNEMVSGFSTDLNLYAIWEPVNYSVLFNANNGSDETSKIDIIYDNYITIPENAFSNVSYKFKEWNTKMDGKGEKYNPGDVVSNLTSIDGETVNLYAIWSKINKKIIFDSNGGSGQMDDLVTQMGVSVKISLNTFVRNGYVFKEWNTKADGSGKSYFEGMEFNDFVTDDDEELVLYAIWDDDYIILVDSYIYNSVDKYIDLVPINTKTLDYRKNIIVNDDYNLIVYNKDKVLKDTDNINTGSVTKIYDKNNNVILEIKNIVRGDPNGDGKISALDYVKIKNHIMKSSVISDLIMIRAADANNDDKVSALDYVRIKNYIMNGAN